ncbi:ankyrin repeat-containing domain protein [Boeremia exigua]|uniref:ankyrin repeat-containing domain protein n=1 Tax=Boeremia exigua TaxID=749465 RepID=UPI001E8DD0B6|nr:ankyrin repeat-containing domain protein [Boeremia exigua]KAH6616786.1 ankyrin repeat-containing domain protein [Boeremia exigua]
MYDALLKTASEIEKHQMIRLFQWVLFARRPLNADELRDALAISNNTSCTTVSQMRTHDGWSDSLASFEQHVKHISKGLVEFRDHRHSTASESGRTAQLIHQSVADYLLERWLKNDNYDQTETAHIELSRSCLRYLTLEEVLSSPFPLEDSFTSKYPLASYATNNLFDHLKSSPWDLTKQCYQVSTFLTLQWTPLTRTSLALSTLWRFLALPNIHEEVHWPFHGAAGFHALAALGSKSSLKAVEELCSPIHGRFDRARCRPLHSTSIDSHKEIILALLNQHTESYTGRGSSMEHSRASLTNFHSRAVSTIASAVKPETMVFLGLMDADLDIGRMSRDVMLLYFAISSRSTTLFDTMITQCTCLNGAIYFALTTCTSEEDTVLENMVAMLLQSGASTARSWTYQSPASIKSEESMDEALQLAFKRGLTHMFDLLVEYKVSKVSLDVFGPNQLITAVTMGHVGIATALLKDEPSAVEQLDARKLTALDLAFRHNRLDVVEVLLELGQYSAQSSTLSNFFFKLVDSEKTHILEVRPGSQQNTVIVLTAQRGSPKIFRLVLDMHQMNVYANDEQGHSLLWYAARGGWTAMAELLLDANDVNMRDKHHNTPLLLAVLNGHFDIVTLLLSTNRVDVNAKGLINCTPLMLAVKKGRTDMITLLLAARGVDLNTTNRFGCSLLQEAAGSGDLDVVKLLLGTPQINIHAKDSDGSSALHYAARYCHIPVVKLLVETGEFDDDRISLLWAAVRAQVPELIKALLGTDHRLIKVKNEQGQSLLWQVTASGSHEALQILLALPKIDLGEKDEAGRSLLWQAVQTKNSAVVKLLLGTGKFHVGCTDEKVGDTPFSCVGSEGNDALATLLLDFHKATIGHQGGHGHSPRCEAIGHLQLTGR